MTNPDEEAAHAVARLLLSTAKNAGAFSAEKGQMTFRQKLLSDLELSHVNDGFATVAVGLASTGDKGAKVAVHTAIWQFVAAGEPELPEIEVPFVGHCPPILQQKGHVSQSRHPAGAPYQNV